MSERNSSLVRDTPSAPRLRVLRNKSWICWNDSGRSLAPTIACTNWRSSELNGCAGATSSLLSAASSTGVTSVAATGTGTGATSFWEGATTSALGVGATKSLGTTVIVLTGATAGGVTIWSVSLADLFRSLRPLRSGRSGRSPRRRRRRDLPLTSPRSSAATSIGGASDSSLLRSPLASLANVNCDSLRGSSPGKKTSLTTPSLEIKILPRRAAS